jgi:DNA-directed RNA polymerase subunit beta'
VDDEHPEPIVLRRKREATATRRCWGSTLGRFLFNEAFPERLPFHDAPVKKRASPTRQHAGGALPACVVAESPTSSGPRFESRRVGFSPVSIADVKTPDSKAELLEKFEAEAEKVEGQYERGVITDDERRQKEIEVWSEATARVRDAMQAEMRRRSSTRST